VLSLGCRSPATIRIIVLQEPSAWEVWGHILRGNSFGQEGRLLGEIDGGREAGAVDKKSRGGDATNTKRICL